MSWKETYRQWKQHENLETFVQEDLKKLEDQKEQLEDAFYKSLEFGTAGMRGVIGAGTNRMNVYTIRQATKGLAAYIDAKGQAAKDRGVVISYDSRHFSREFAFEAAKTLGQQGIKSYVFESLRPTPELSFAVRHLEAAAGIMVTASHNPPEYNGYKVYGEDGGQLLPAESDRLIEYVQAVNEPLNIEVADQEDLQSKGLLTIIGEKVDRAYLDMMRAVTIDTDIVEEGARDLRIVYTPLHGTGQYIGTKALYNAGFRQIISVDSQKDPDPDFSTVDSPNPETKEAFNEAIKVGREHDADILIATDPDADRLGVAVKTSDTHYEVLSGNQIAALLVDYILKQNMKQDKLPHNAAIVKSIVSSEFPAVIAERYSVKTENVLTGFKFIAEKIEQYKTSRDHTFMFGFEESYGYLAQSFVRDKDAIQALVLIAEVAAYYKLQNRSLVDALFDLYNDYGHYAEKTISITMEGASGEKKIKELLANLREQSPSSFGGVKVVQTEDYLTQQWTTADGETGEIDLPTSNVLKYILSDRSWIAARPSGTEPKIKFYIGAVDGARKGVQEKIEAIEQDIEKLVN
ncbi:phospho-sugar mutase [Dolosigranulum savutiense]|uniref:Phosphoglucomutase n=1 Tax=Dolosigranulum savutiense TaxID=3110288 RepID=A0AB74U642_9LACT